jgi:hypothetical protein
MPLSACDLQRPKEKQRKKLSDTCIHNPRWRKKLQACHSWQAAHDFLHVISLLRSAGLAGHRNLKASPSCMGWIKLESFFCCCCCPWKLQKFFHACASHGLPTCIHSFHPSLHGTIQATAFSASVPLLLCSFNGSTARSKRWIRRSTAVQVVSWFASSTSTSWALSGWNPLDYHNVRAVNTFYEADSEDFPVECTRSVSTVLYNIAPTVLVLVRWIGGCANWSLRSSTDQYSSVPKIMQLSLPKKSNNIKFI